MFYDGTVLWLFDGASWDPIGGQGAPVGTTPPSSNPPANPVPGQQWFTGTTLYVWDGNAWVPVSATKTSIQATAPSNPNPGDLWYDGTQLRIWSGSAWALVGPGATVGPVPTTTDVLRLFQVTAMSITGGAWEALPFSSTPTIDTLNGWDMTTRRWTPTKAGTYLCFIRCPVGGGAGSIGTALLKNDTGAFSGIEPWVILQTTGSSAAISGWIGGGGVVSMNGTTDYLRMWAYTNTTYPFGGNAATPLMDVWLLP